MRPFIRIRPLAARPRVQQLARHGARHVPAAPRPLDCLLVAVMAAAVALVALLCSAAPRLGFAQVGRIGGWLP